MSEILHQRFAIADFDAMSDGQRLLSAPSLNGILQINTYMVRDSNPLLRIDKFHSDILISREDGIPIRVAIGGYRLLDEDPLSPDDTKTVVSVFERPSPTVEFVADDGGWFVNPDSARVIHPNRARRLAMTLGTFAIAKPVVADSAYLD